MRIEIEKLDNLGGRFAEECSIEELTFDDQNVRLDSAAKIEGTIKGRGSEIDLRGNVRASVEILCDRCLKPVTMPIQADFDTRFVPSVSWNAAPEHELADDDLKLSTYDGESIDLKELAREEILLAIPGHVLCTKDCKGLCPVCGGNLNTTDCKCAEQQVDPRWAALKQVKFSL